MSSKADEHNQEHLDRVFLHALNVLPPDEIRVVEDQISTCKDCQKEIETLRPIVGAFVGWSTDVLRPNHYGDDWRSESQMKRAPSRSRHR
jgi:hypothetical protein